MLGVAVCSVSTGNAAVAADGQKIYEQACAKCHSSGPGAFFSGAPKLGAASWPLRAEKAGSIEELVSITAQGKGKMPAQGGARGLPDADLKAAIEYILGQAPFK